MKSFVVIIFFIVLCIVYAQAPYDPITFLSDTYVLRENEYASGYVEIGSASTQYYVVKIYSGNDFLGYVALHKYKKEFLDKEVTLKKLFQTAYFLDKYSEFKNKFAESPSRIWFPSQYAYIEDIKKAIETEKYELQLISEVLASESIVRRVSKLTAKLNELSAKLSELKELELSANNFESEFLSNPKVGLEKELKEKLISCYNKLMEIAEIKSDYEQELAILRGEISKASGLTIDEKKSLQKTAEPPSEFSAIEQWYTSAINSHFKENLETIYKNSIGKSDSFVIFAKERLARNSCYEAIYAKDEQIYKVTSKAAQSLVEVKDYLKDPNKYFYWKKQNYLHEFEKSLKNAIKYAKKDDYKNCLFYAKKAKNYAIKVISAGLEFPTEEKNDYIVFILLAFLIIMVLFVIARKARGAEI